MKKQILITVICYILISCNNQGNISKSDIETLNQQIKLDMEKDKNRIPEKITKENIIGDWWLLLPENGYSKTDHIKISKSKVEIMFDGYYQGSKLDGNVYFIDSQCYMIDKIHGKYKINRVESIDQERHNSLSVNLETEPEEIWIGNFQKKKT